MVLATKYGGELYRRRNIMIEPVFGHTKFNRRIDASSVVAEGRSL